LTLKIKKEYHYYYTNNSSKNFLGDVCFLEDNKVEVFRRENAPEKFRISEDTAEKLILIIGRIRATK